ncbi:hypothetical protein [Cryptosporangium phraense]|uniref:Uncharacterized protein n=1 Tax=Cryptosporangium phraense TaxID=2593070 RepID=A0A545AEW2_9ACTN|nr:hypothetical protein [Cryptosporangium phraense]TQS39800.1 hypothetical protein FL583_38170 [Cryptosporangium phraense]
MTLAIREVALSFATAQSADAWVAANIPQGLAKGPILWQLVVHTTGSRSVRLVQGFSAPGVASDWQSALLPEAGGAESMTVSWASADAYRTGDEPGQEGPGRVWLTVPNIL